MQEKASPDTNFCGTCVAVFILHLICHKTNVDSDEGLIELLGVGTRVMVFLIWKVEKSV